MKRVILSGLLAIIVAAACSGETALVGSEGEPAAATSTATSTPESLPEPTGPPHAGLPGTPEIPASEPEPVPYVPAGRPGSDAAYDEMIARLEQLVPAELRGQVPWPDLRDPDPVVAQTQIFDLWIWMAANLTEPQLVEIMAAPGSPSRETVVSVFGRLERDRVFEERNGQPYRAFDHLVVTFESAGLPLWLARDVPEDAVVVYYSDSSGPVDVIDQESGSVLAVEPGVPVRTWLAIMVPTDVGWQLWRDQLIDPSDTELQVPDVPPPPGNAEGERTPEL